MTQLVVAAAGTPVFVNRDATIETVMGIFIGAASPPWSVSIWCQFRPR
jgi:hypothetical protein